MVPSSPADALGTHALEVGSLVVEVVRARHARSAEAHQVSESRYAMGFGSQWRDLLVDLDDALRDRTYRSYKLPPAGYKLPVVNDCILYAWRVPDITDAVSEFASSPTRRNGFTAPLLEPMLFEPGFTGEPDPVAEEPAETELERVVRVVSDAMPLVLIMVKSTPRQLQSIEWAVAVLDEQTGKVKLYGQETIWESETNTDGAENDVESFDSGAPDHPAIAPRQQQGPQPNA